MSSGSNARKKTGHLVPIAALTLVIVMADLLTKVVVTRWIGPSADEHQWWAVDGKVGFDYGRNSGAAFGLLQGNPELLALISVFVAVGFCWLIVAEVQRRLVKITSAGLLLGGALGNLVERVRHAYVTDFIGVGPWPRFNLADSAITVGVAIFVIAILFQAAPGNVDSSDPE